MTRQGQPADSRLSLPAEAPRRSELKGEDHDRRVRAGLRSAIVIN